MKLSRKLTKRPTKRMTLNAIKEPQYHRYLCNLPFLFEAQLNALKLIEYTICNRNLPCIYIRSARQTMKNEVDAFLCLRMLLIFAKKGGNFIRTGLTNTQVVNSKRRISSFAKKDIFTFYNQKLQWSEGNFLNYKNASIQLTSAFGTSTASQGQTRAVGGTADIGLSIDEAHLVNEVIYNSTFSPMVSMTAAPKILYGIAAEKTDILYKGMSQILDCEPKGYIWKNGVINLPASFWVDHLGEKHAWSVNYLSERKRLGADHPTILTNYDLVDVDAVSGYLSKTQINSICESDFPRQSTPKDGKDYIILIDIAGGDEDDLESLNIKDSNRDFCAAWICEIDFSKINENGLPRCNLVDLILYRDLDLTVSQNIFDSLIQKWKPAWSVIDGRGIGEQIANYIEKRWAIENYKANTDSVNYDCTSFLGLVNNECVKLFRNDGSPEYNEVLKQLSHTQRELKYYENIQKIAMSIKKPKGGKIDAVKALTYLQRAIDKFI